VIIGEKKMKVFSREVFDNLEGQNAWTWVTKCDGKTKEECEKLGYGIFNKWCIDVPDFVKGQEIEVSCGWSWNKGYKFHSYDPDLKDPFLCVDSDEDITNWTYARAIEPEYKAYTEPKLEWLNEHKNIKAKGIDGFHTIYGCEKRYNDWTILVRDNETNDEDTISLLQMYNYWEWADNSPCGEKE